MPLKNITQRTKNTKPWITPDIKDYIKIKNQLHKQSLKKNTEEFTSYYKTYKNKVNHDVYGFVLPMTCFK